MTTLNTIIEEEKINNSMRRFEPFLKENVERSIREYARRELKKLLTTAMQRAYEAGRGERDTYWKERVRKEVEQGMQGVSDAIPTPKHIKKMARSWGEEGTDYNEGFIEGARWVIGLVYWFVIPFAGERGITIDTRIPTPITNEDN